MLEAVTQHIPSTAAGTGDTWYLPWSHPGKFLLKKVKFAPATAVAVGATDYTTVTLAKNTLAAPTTWTDIGTWNTNTGGTAMVIGTTIDIDLTEGAGLLLSEGEQIRVTKADSGTGDILDGTFAFLAEKVPR